MAFNLDVKDPVTGHYSTFKNGDILHMKALSDTGVLDNWLIVQANPDMSNAGYARYSVEHAPGVGGSGSYPPGTAIVDYGHAGSGYILMSSDESTSPYIDIATHGGSPWLGPGVAGGITPHTRLGNLNGILGLHSPEWGLAAGADLTDSTKPYVIASDKQVTLSNVNMKLTGSAPSIAVGSPPPTAYNAGSGVWIDQKGVAIVSGNNDIFDISPSGLTFLETAPGGIPTPNIRWYQGITSRGTYNGYAGRIEMSSGFLPGGGDSLQIEAMADSGAATYSEAMIGVRGPTGTQPLGVRAYAWWDPSAARSSTFGVYGIHGASYNKALTLAEFVYNDTLADVQSGAISLDVPTTIAMTPVTSGSPTMLSVNPAANTGLTAGTEVPDVWLGLNRVSQWATGALATQRAVIVNQPTYAFVGASTITNAATVAIVGAPVAGTNATLTNKYALWVQAGDSLFAGDVLALGKGKGLQAQINDVNVYTQVGTLDLTTAYQDNPSVTATFTPAVAEYAIVWVTVNFNCTTGTAACNQDDVLNFQLVLDGTGQTPAGGLLVPTAAHGQLSGTQYFKVSLTAAAHTLKVQSKNATGARGRCPASCQMMVWRIAQ